MKRIIVIGDVHGDWNFLNALINKERPDLILACGDFGYWPKFHNTTLLSGPGSKKWDQYGIKTKEAKLYWCDGNHEDHWAIRTELVEKGISEIMPNVFYMKRGSTLELPDKRIVLFMGGAESTDKIVRTLGHDWFPEETIKDRDLMELPEHKVDIVISHTCPKEFYKKLITDRNVNSYPWYETRDPSREALSYILSRYKPSLWYFGHFHMFKTGYYGDTRWTVLNMAPNSFWWKDLAK